MKYPLVFILFILPIWVWAQKVEIINLGKINSSKDDLSPTVFIENNVAYFVFSSNRKKKQSILFKSLIKSIDNQCSFNLGEVEPFEKNFSIIKGNSYPCFSKKGAQLFFTKTYLKKNTKTIFIREKEGATRGALRSLPMSSCADKWDLAHPYLSEDEKELYFASNMPGGFGGWDLYVSYFENDHWGPAINLGPNVNSEGDEVTPFISKNSQLFFSSNRIGGYGGFDIYESNLMNGFWGNSDNIGKEINSTANELDFINYKIKKTGFFSSDRAGGVGGYDIYYFKT